jgi:hypothetical protein
MQLSREELFNTNKLSRVGKPSYGGYPHPPDALGKKVKVQDESIVLWVHLFSSTFLG